MIDIKKEGNWLGVKVALQQLPLELRTAATWGQRRVAEKLVAIVKKHINRQDLGWAPRSARTTPNDPRILVDTEAYYSNIKAWKKGNDYNAGVPMNATNSKGINISYYAAIQEVGYGNIPARPLWGPSFKEMGGTKGARAIVTMAIYDKVKRLRALGLNVNLGNI